MFVMVSAYAEHFDLGGVGNEATFVPGRTAGNGGEKLPDPAAGAGFGGGQHPAAREQLLAEFGGELVQFFVAHTSHCSPFRAAIA
jgi:hypothetical protein